MHALRSRFETAKKEVEMLAVQIHTYSILVISAVPKKNVKMKPYSLNSMLKILSTFRMFLFCPSFGFHCFFSHQLKCMDLMHLS